MSDPTDLHTLCGELLDASVDALDTIPTYDATLVGAPDRAFISPGQPALDCCDQLAVWAQSVTESATAGGLPAGTKNRQGRINLAGLVVTVTRCVPVPDDRGNPPRADLLTAAAAQTNADAWALWNHLWALWQSGLLFTFCDEVFWDGLRSIPPSGGCGGWNLALRVRLDGYDDVAGSS